MRNYKTLLAVVLAFFVILFLSIFILNSYAALPISGDTSTSIYTGTDKVSAADASYAVSLVKLQWELGSFNNLRPVLLYCLFNNGSYNYRLVLSDPDAGNNPNVKQPLGYIVIGGQFVPSYSPGSGTASVPRLVMTDKGFARYYPTATPTDIAGVDVLGYFDTSLNDFVYNDTGNTVLGGESYVGGNGLPIFYSVYTNWAQYDIGSSGSYGEGYSDGYDDGYAEGFELGDNFGYNRGYAEGIEAEGVLLDVGGIVDSSVGGIRTIIEGALDFELFGINVAGLLMTVTVVFIVAFVIRKFSNKS